jgi:hypothetical protein
MYSVTINELKPLLLKHYDYKIPIMLTGGYGIGKSESVIQTAQELAESKKKKFVLWNKLTSEEKNHVEMKVKDYFVLIDERLSEYESSDIKGIPDLSGDVCVWKPQRWLNLLCHPDADGILFFDELNLASKDVQASAYKIIHDRFINDVKLSDNVCIVACGNRLQDEANVVTMPRPLRDRMSELELRFDVDTFLDYAEKNEISTQVMSFLRYKPDRCLRIGESKDDKSTTPRGWFRANTLLNGDDVRNSKDLLSSAIGEVVSTELIAFIKLSDTVDLNKIIKNPKEIKEVKEISTRYSVMSALVEKYRKNTKLFEPLIECCNYLDLEFGILMLRMMIQANKTHFKANIYNNKLFKEKFAEKMHSVLYED